ncbi:uncharacterized protein LOC105831674 [Monomorium pharaonis]|uniref:uncharacterized protein LOC105831674 n=1 Tax=Monomorium pharaonis TaxID=307658 RepID=UPI00063F90D4|nr:uncharacterized protein LOC105831674 [Monomorium pharaonis]XP_012527429.1 uncharacterized protein LOC105831674 [Monomorium pharaonis]XP_012527430.1 uncharacterized protein LOC105831674 [Monomorium pharaonis]
MSESDDSDILADIQALDEALALGVKPVLQCPSQHSDDSSSSHNFDDLEDNADCLNYLSENQCIDESLNAYEINTRLITGLTIAKKKLTTLLEICEKKIQLLDERMESKEGWNSSSRTKLNNAGIPYFKDKNYFSAPKNDDTKLKEARNELSLFSLKKPNRWSRRDRETLLAAIHNQAIESVLSGENDKKPDPSTSDNQAEKDKFVLPRNFNEMVEAMGEKDFDWYKISITDFNNKHSPGECRAMWNVYLHPNIEKSEWTSEEDKKLLKCVKEYNYQDWDAITQKLGTNRSAYQCFIRYNTIKKVPSSGHAWTRQEDKHLIKIVNTIRVGDYIPWAEVSNHMRHMTKQQVYVRWMYSSAPHLKKGRFNKAETSTLLKAVRKYGTNFSKISSIVMPHRTSVQLQLRYETVMMNIKNEFSNLWTVNDDLKLINLHTKYKNDWSKISTYFSRKSRTQVRHRYYAIVRYTMRGISIENIPRPVSTYLRFKKITINKKLSSHNMPKCPLEKPKQYSISVFEIQLRLYETLSFPPSVRPNNSDEEPYSIEQLLFDTKKLYNTLKLLNGNLTIPHDIVNYVHLNSRKKQLLISLKDHLNIGNSEVQNNEVIEQFRTKMFGNATEGDNSDFFIPPLPFGGYIRLKKSRKRNTSTDYDLDVNKKFLIDLPIHFSVSKGILDFISIDEVIQFDRFSQLLINDCHNYDQQNARLFNSFFKRNVLRLKKDPDNISNKASSEYNESNVNTNVEDYERLNELRETVSINEANETEVSDIILPNRATLLGWKNLLLWKLLYECQDEVRQEVQQQCESIARYRGFGNDKVSKQTATNSRLSAETKSVQYQLLQTRLLQLFKLPISLSNTTLKEEMEMIFQRDKIAKQDVLKKRKRKDTRTRRIKKMHLSNYSEDESEDESERIDPLRIDVTPETLST